ncbi:MAG: photosystem II biogenesis protein Psp29 [Cyanobium sp.]
MSAPQTVADSKRVFHAAFPHVIAPLYRRMVDELLVELHLLSHQVGFRPDPLFAVGLVQVFDAFARGYRPAQQRDPLLTALCAASGFDAAALRRTSEEALAAMEGHGVDQVQGWIASAGSNAPQPLAAALASIQRSDFHYSRLMAVGLLALLERAGGAADLEPQALRDRAHDLAAAMGLLRERVDKDLGLYVSNLEKMAQAVELMEETIAADRRKRERGAEAQAADPVSGAAEAAPSGV